MSQKKHSAPDPDPQSSLCSHLLSSTPRRRAWKRCVHSGHHDNTTWGHAAAADFAPVPRMCRLRHFDGGYVHNGLLRAAGWVLDRECDLLQDLLDRYVPCIHAHLHGPVPQRRCRRHAHHGRRAQPRQARQGREGPHQVLRHGPRPLYRMARVASSRSVDH
ncbi:hypothetical protein VPH35_072986 [Triticum aestivum]